MVRVLTWRNYRVYIYPERGSPHHDAHCHVVSPDGATVIRLEDMAIIRGRQLPRALYDVLHQHAEELTVAWHLVNGGDK